AARSAGPAAGRSSGSQGPRIEGQELELGHLLDRVAKALPPEARALDAAVRHVVDAEGRDVVDHQAADLDPVERCVDDADVVREEPGLEAELARTRPVERLECVAERLEGDDGGEDLLARDLHLLADARDHGRLDDAAVALAAGQDPRTAVD